MSRIIKIVLALLMLAVIALIGGMVLWWVGSTAVRTTTQNDTSKTPQELLQRPDMASTIATIFDKENPKSAYEWAIGTDTNGIETLSESNSFALSGQSHVFQLRSSKAKPTDDTFTISNYLSLIVTVDTKTGKDTLVAVDNDADGGIDAAYINDVQVTDTKTLTDIQNQYTTELVLMRNYLLSK